MQRVALVLFIACELLYYLLIAQTGIVEYFYSDIFLIAPLPIGGLLGSYFISQLKYDNDIKISIALLVQLGVSFFYPNLNVLLLFILGLSVGSIAPLMINELKKATFLEIGIALSLSYAIGTYLFTSEVSQRGVFAIILTTVTFFSSIILPKVQIKREYIVEHSLLIMTLWIFLDSALFETLSRNVTVSIWRDGFTSEIIVFHIVGVLAAFSFRFNKNSNEIFILLLFAFSYLLFFLEEGLILSIVYPFVISYYNVVILKTLINKGFKTISIYMVFIGWIASGSGLLIALENLIIFVPTIFLISLFKILNTNIIEKKELNYV